MSCQRPLYRWAIVTYDRLYRAWHGLAQPASEVGVALRIELRRSSHPVQLRDGTVVRRGDSIGVLHLNNDRVATLGASRTSIAAGLELRRHLVASLHVLAERCRTDRQFACIHAFSATTIYYRGLNGLGFEEGSDWLWWPRLVGAYQHSLSAVLRRQSGRLGRGAERRNAKRLWLSRTTLIDRYGSLPHTVEPQVSVDASED